MEGNRVSSRWGEKHVINRAMHLCNSRFSWREIAQEKTCLLQKLVFKYLSVRICVCSTQVLVNCFEKIVLATNNSGFNSTYTFACKWRGMGNRKKRKGIEQELTGEEDSIAEADRVLCHLVMFLKVILHWIFKMKYSCYQRSFVTLGWLVYWVLVEKCAARQKEIGNHRFQK